MAGVVAFSEFIKEHEEMKRRFNWGQPHVIILDEVVGLNRTISFGLHLTNYIATVNSHTHAQFIQMITCHLTFVQKMKKNTVDRKMVVNNLFDDNGDRQTFEAAAAPEDNMEGNLPMAFTMVITMLIKQLVAESEIL